MDPLLSWNSDLGVCSCPTTDKIISVTDGVISCISCDALVYANSKLTYASCNCTSKVMKWNGNTCSCPNFNIVNSDLTCSVCTTQVMPDNFTCICNVSINSFWNDIKKKCETCGTSTYRYSITSTVQNNVGCSCSTGYIWDVMTNGCIKTCSPNCVMNCNAIPNTQKKAAVTGDSTTYHNITGGEAVKTYYLSINSNYK